MDKKSIPNSYWRILQMDGVLRTFVGLFVLLGLLSCGERGDNAPKDEIINIIKSTLPQFFEFNLSNIETIKDEGGLYRINIKGELIPKVDLFSYAKMDDEYSKLGIKVDPYFHIKTLYGEPLIRLLKKVGSTGQKVEVYGAAMGRKMLDKWEMRFMGFDKVPDAIDSGKPLEAYAADEGEYVLADSSTANEHFARLLSKKKERDRKVRERLSSIIPLVSAGNIFNGDISCGSYGDITKQKFKLTFKSASSDGKIIKAVLQNINNEKQSLSLKGDINFGDLDYPDEIELQKDESLKEIIKERWKRFFTMSTEENTPYNGNILSIYWSSPLIWFSFNGQSISGKTIGSPQCELTGQRVK